MKATIPENFLKVMNKMFPEICNIEISDIQTSNISLSEMLYGASRAGIQEYKDSRLFFVKVKIVIGRYHDPKHDAKGYTEELTNLFKYVYPEMDFVQFRVEHVKLMAKPTREEMVAELFYPIK